MIRPAICAGTWYPNDKKEIASYLVDEGREQHAVTAGVVPHAGWLYSGKTAGEVFSSMAPPARYVLVGPNHRGLGAAVSVFSEGAWETPLGNLPVDSTLARSILRHSKSAQADILAHMQEHSLEVQMPFIRYCNPGASIVPISLFDYRPDICRELGLAMAAAVKENAQGGTTVLLASSDMSHYVSAVSAAKADRFAIDRILALDPFGLLETVREHDISMCGSGPVAAVLWAALELGATSAELIRYTHSGEVTGENDQVVGYAGILIR